MHAMADSHPAQAIGPLADPEAFGELFERNARDIYAFCFRRTGDGRASEDLAQAVFLEAWRRRNEVELAPEDVRPWLFGVALNLIRNQRRSLRRHRAALERLPRPRSDNDLGDDLAQRLDDEQRARELLERLRGLSRADQDVIALCAWAELSYEQAAKVLGVPVGTVRSRLARARARLKEEDR
jgi:RNA polymerase sigma factor (sigma-70 family)